MPTTPGQIQSILSIKREFNFDTKVLKLTDQSPYNVSLTLTSPWKADVIYLILDPTGDVVYKNVGWDANTFGSPDTEVTNSSTAGNNFQKSIPSTTSGSVLMGTYSIFASIQITEDVGGTNTIALARLNGGYPSTSLASICTPLITATQTSICATALITDTDTTKYGNYVTLTRTHQLIPPSLSGQPTQTTNAASVTYSATPYTGTWSWKIVSVLTYLTDVNTYVTVTLTGESEFVVKCDTNFCKLLCLVRKYYNTYFSTFGLVASQQDARNWLLVMSNFQMAYQEMLCGRPDSEIQSFIDQIYEITGLSPDCGCGCGGDQPTPIIPTNIINGQPGADGTNGVTPTLRSSGGFIQVSYDSGATFTNLIALSSLTGPAGADGADGGYLLTNQTGITFNRQTSLEDIKTFSITGNQLSSDEDMIKIRVKYALILANTMQVQVVLINNGNTYVIAGASASDILDTNASVSNIQYDLTLSRVDQNNGNTEIQIIGSNGLTSAYLKLGGFNPPLASLDFSLPIVVKAQALADVANPTGPSGGYCNMLRIEYLRKK